MPARKSNAGRPRKPPISTMQAFHIIKSLESGMEREKVKSKYNVGERQLRNLEAGERKRKKLKEKPREMPTQLTPTMAARKAVIEAVARARLRHGLPPADIGNGFRRATVSNDLTEEIEEIEELSA